MRLGGGHQTPKAGGAAYPLLGREGSSHVGTMNIHRAVDTPNNSPQLHHAREAHLRMRLSANA